MSSIIREPKPMVAIERRRQFLTAEWRYLAMLNYEVDPEVVAPYVPSGTQIDFFRGRTYVSLVGFLFKKTALLGLPIPFHRNFEELNLRCYVVREEKGETRRGVVFIKELVPRWAVAKVAHWAYNENYEAVPMRHQIVGVPDQDVIASPCIEGAYVDYQWKKAGEWNDLAVNVRGTAQPLLPGSEAEFIAEHYWGYCRQRDGGTIEYQVAHRPWNVWHASDARFQCNVARFYPKPFVKVLGREPTSAFLLDGSAVQVAFPNRIV